MSAMGDIRQRAEAATKGPWRTEAVTEGRFAGVESRVFSVRASHILLSDTDGHAGQATNHNAEFIAHARTDIPRLLGALDAVDDQLRWFDAAIANNPDVKVSARVAARRIRTAVYIALEANA